MSDTYIINLNEADAKPLEPGKTYIFEYDQELSPEANFRLNAALSRATGANCIVLTKSLHLGPVHLSKGSILCGRTEYYGVLITGQPHQVTCKDCKRLMQTPVGFEEDPKDDELIEQLIEAADKPIRPPTHRGYEFL
jgi:hypothetical protein